MILVDTNVILDLLTGDRVWSEWSQRALELAAARDVIAINDATAKRSVNSEPLSVSTVWMWSGKLARKRLRKPAAVWPRRSGRISR